MAQTGDSFHHPASEEELVRLVQQAYREGRQLRVRGAAHSVSHATYADPLDAIPNRVEEQSPPVGANVNVMLDRYRGWRVVDEGRRLVEADAGINLGADPNDPTQTATVETSLLYQLALEKGWTLSDTGGITHQTVSGFVATGSSGGSLTYSINEDIHGFRVIDGTGEIHELTRDDDDEFYAMAPNMGLLGVVSKVVFRCVEAFNISGQESVTRLDDCAVDVLGPGSATRPSLETFLRDAEYARLEWWPQRGVDRVLLWQCQRMRPQLGFRPTRYEEFTDAPEGAEIAISILFTIFGNLDDLSRAKEVLRATFDQLDLDLDLDALPDFARLGEVGKLLARFLSAAAELGVDAAITMLTPFAGLIERELPVIFPRVVGAFIGLDADKKDMQRGEPQAFRDTAWQGLPMDNQADDRLVPTAFTELWVPLPRTQETMKLLDGWFSEPRDARESYRRTGLYAWELYSAKPSPFWMAASHSDGGDEWRDGVLRIDVYWFGGDPGDPATTFFPPLWELVRDAGIPFRLHWGKYQPTYAVGDRRWVEFFSGHYPRWDDFLRLRAERDPNNIFLTSYWRERFGLWDEPEPAPIR